MWRSNLKNLILTSLVLLVAAGCWGPREKSKDEIAKENAGATYFVTKAGGDSIDSANDIETKWGTPRSKLYSFYACVSDTITNKPIRGITFDVANSRENVSYESTPTNDGGCFSWSERVPFNLFSEQPKKVLVERKARALGGHSGERLLRFSVNPWAGLRGSNSKEVIYLGDNDIPEEELISEKELQESGGGAVQLLMEKERVHISRMREMVSQDYKTDKDGDAELDTAGVELEMRIEMTPYMRLKDANGQPDDIYFNGGEFRIEAVLLASNLGNSRDKKLILTPEIPIDNAKISRGKIYATIRTNLTRRVTRGRIELAVRVIPLDAPYGNIKPFDGHYILSERFDRIEGSKGLTVVSTSEKDLGQFDFASFLKDERFIDKDSIKAFLKARKAFVNKPYLFKTLDVRFQRIKEGETATTRTVQFRVKACIMDDMGSRVGEGEEFQIEIVRDYRIKSKYLMKQPPAEPRFIRQYTDNEGCIKWMDEILHKYYKQEEYVFPEAVITNVSIMERAKRAGKRPESTRLTMVVNPWDEKWTFGADKRSLLQSYVDKIQKQDRVQSRFQIFDYTYQTTRFLYDIDEFMNLQVKKTVLLRIYPKVLRYAGIVNGRKTTEKLRDGIYLMKIAFQKDYLDPASKGVQVVPLRGGCVGNKRYGYLSSDQFKGMSADEKNKHIKYIADNVKEECDQGLAPIEPDKKVDRKNGEYTTRIGAKIRVREQISVTQKLVRVQDGVVITPVEFSMRDLRLMRIRSNLLIQLETIDEDKLLQANEYRKEADRQIKRYITLFDEGKLNSSSFKDQCLLSTNQTWLDSVKEFVVDIQKKQGTFWRNNRNFADLNDEFSDRSEQRAQLKRLLEEKRDDMVREIVTHVDSRLKMRLVYSDDRSKLLQRVREGKSLWTKHMSEELYKPVQDICDSTYTRMLEGMELNDFTVNPAAPIVNLNLLKDEDSGLSARTFVGPLTLIFNTNSSHMRPTDNLDEAFCEDDSCNQLSDRYTLDSRKKDDSTYQNSPLFGSIRHLLDMSVDRLIERKMLLRQAYKDSMEVESLLYNFLKFNKMSYISLGDEEKLGKYSCGPVKRVKVCMTKDFEDYIVEKDSQCDGNVHEIEHFDNRRCITETKEFVESKEDLLAGLNNVESIFDSPWKGTEKVTLEDLEKMVDERTFPKHVAKRFCHLFSHQFTEAYNKAMKKNSWYNRLNVDHVLEECVVSIERGNLGDRQYPFELTQRLKVLKTGRYKFMGGKSLNINVGSSFGVSHTNSVSFSGGVKPLSIPIIGDAIKGFDFGWSSVSRKSVNDGTTVSQQTFLVMQTAALDVELLSYRKCAVFKFLPQNMNYGAMTGLAAEGVTERVAEATKEKRYNDPAFEFRVPSLMLCENQKKVAENPARAVRERYYYFTQHFTEGDMLDPGDIYNHPWLLQLRGVRDFRAFISLIEGQNAGFFNSRDNESISNTIFMRNQIENSPQWPIDKLSDTYRRVLPTFPGLYTMIPGVDDVPNKFEYPWNNSPSDTMFNSNFDNSWDLEDISSEESSYESPWND